MTGQDFFYPTPYIYKYGNKIYVFIKFIKEEACLNMDIVLKASTGY